MAKTQSKPRVLVDIKKPGIHAFSYFKKEVNLNGQKLFNISLRLVKGAAIFINIIYLMFGWVSAPTWPSSTLAAQTNTEERQQLQKQLSDLESQISEYQGVVDKYKQQGSSLQGEINKYNANIAKINLQIKAINLAITNLDSEISDTKNQIQVSEADLALNKDALGKALQRLYENEDSGLAEILLQNPQISDFFTTLDNLVSVQDSLTLTVNKIADIRDGLIDKKQALALKRQDNASIKAYQDSQKMAIDSVKQQKAQLLSLTKGQESKYQTLLKETQKTAAQIRSRIFELLGGGELTFADAYKFAQFAEQATGIRAALVLAILDRESALGQNVGKCSYQEAMHPTRDIPIFLQITAALGIDPNSVPVSCANGDGLYGGAMGPAQFIPSTWNLYASAISTLTGSNPPSPWRNSDAFMATALYLRDSMSGCNAIYSKQFDIERCAAAKYYAGKNWRSFIQVGRYGYRVADQARQFQSDIDVLNS